MEPGDSYMALQYYCALGIIYDGPGPVKSESVAADMSSVGSTLTSGVACSNISLLLSNSILKENESIPHWLAFLIDIRRIVSMWVGLYHSITHSKDLRECQ